MSIRESFSLLDCIRRQMLIESLNQSERKQILACLQTPSINPPLCKELLTKINNIFQTPLNISKKIEDSSFIRILFKKYEETFGEIAYFFGILTAKKTNQLAEDILNKNFSAASTIFKNCFERSSQFSDENLKNVLFKDCHFTWVPFSNSSLSNVIFENCVLENISFLNASLKGCHFHNCHLKESMFFESKIEDCHFTNCSIIASSFEDAFLTSVMFRYCSLPATHFLETTIKNSVFVKCHLQDAIFFDNFIHFTADDFSKKTLLITRQISAMLVDSENEGISIPKVFLKLDQIADLIPLRINITDKKHTMDNVNSEICTLLNKIKSNVIPILQQVHQKITYHPHKYTKSMKILKKSEILAKHVHAFFLPGGEDVPPLLYGKQEEKSTKWSNTYRRSILELGMIYQSYHKGIPLMAVCRGFQMVNVFFGASLVQHIEGQQEKLIEKFQLTDKTKRGLYHQALKNPIFSSVLHHQGVLSKNSPKEHLEPAIINHKIIKASEPKYGGSCPMLLLQFHPELYTAIPDNKMNDLFFKIFSDCTKAFASKKQTLRLLSKKFYKRSKI